MKLRPVLALVRLAISFALPGFAQQTNTPDPKLRQALDDLFKRETEAYNNNDAAAIAATFTEALHLRCAHLLGGRNFSFRAFCGAIRASMGVLGGSKNRRVHGALKPVQKPDSFGIAVKALVKSRVRSPGYPV